MSLLVSDTLLWTGTSMDWAWALGLGLVALLGVLSVKGRAAYRNLRRQGPDMIQAQALRTQAAAEEQVVEALQGRPRAALGEVEGLLTQRVAAIEAGLAMLLGGLRTAGLISTLAVLLGA